MTAFDANAVTAIKPPNWNLEEVTSTKKHVLLTAQGAYIKLEGGNIEVHAPGNVDFKASKK